MSRGLLVAEWIKLRSLRSTYIVIVVAVVVGLSVGLLEMTSVVHHWAQLDPREQAAFDPVADSFSGFEFAELAFGALGVIVGCGEYATGTMRPTLVACPRRLRVYLAKAAVLTGVMAPICLGSALAAFLLGQVVLRASHLGVALSSPHALRAVAGAGLYLLAVTLVGFGIGTVIRHTGGALSLMFGLVFLAWPVARAAEGFSYLPDRWLLVNAADALVSTRRIPGLNAWRTPSLGMACLEVLTYVVVGLGLGAWRATHDA